MHVNTAIQHHNTVKSNPDRYFNCFMADPAEYWYGGGYITMLKDLRDSGQWKMPNNKIALIVGSIPYSVVIANAMKEFAPDAGFEVAFSEVVQTPTTEWGPVLAKVRKVNPGAIANTHFFGSAGYPSYEARGVWWRRGELNPRPSALCHRLYMLRFR